MQQSLSLQNVTWNAVSEPSGDELAQIIRENNLLPIDASFVGNDEQRPEVVVRNNYILLLFSVPVFDKQLRVTSGVPLYMIITPTSVTTLAFQPVVSLEKVFQEYTEIAHSVDLPSEDSAVHLGLSIISELNHSSFRKIKRLSKHIEIAEDAVFHGNERKMVEEIAVLMRDVLDFRKIIHPLLSLFASVPDHAEFSLEAHTEWRRVGNQLRQLSEVLDSLYESSKELRETNDSLLQYKENALLRLLTYYSIIAIPLWILVSPFNPRSAEATSTDIVVFWTVVGFLTVLLPIILWSARRRRIL